MVSLLLEQNDWTLQRLTVHPGIMDSDHMGQIQIEAPAIETIQLRKGDGIAPLLLLSFQKLKIAQPGNKGLETAEKQVLHKTVL